MAGKRFAAVCGIALAIYLVFFAGHYVSGDNAERIAWAKALIDCRCNDISGSFPGLQYTKYGIGQPLLHIPLILAARAIRHATGYRVEGPLNMLIFPIAGALGVGLVFLLLVRNGVETGKAMWRALVIGLSSPWFAYTKLDYGEALVAVLVMAQYLLADTWPLAAGLLGGLAIAMRTDALLWVGITALIAPRERRVWLRIGAGIAPWLVLIALSNYARTGSPLWSGYENDFSTPLLTGLYGLTLSAGKSMLLFAPLLLLYPWAVRELWHRAEQRRLAIWSLALMGAQLLFYAKWWDWSGDDSWGVRFVVLAVMSALTVVAVSRLARTRWFAVLALAGVLLELPAVILGPHASLMLVHLRHPMIRDGFTGAAAPITLDDIRFNPAYSQAVDSGELLLFKLSEGRLASSCKFIAAFNPPLTPAQIPIDILWLNPRPGARRAPQSSGTGS